MEALKAALTWKEKVTTSRKWFISLPSHDVHEKSHPIGILSGVGAVNPII